MHEMAQLLQTYLAQRPAPSVTPGCARASEAGKCARAVWYRVHNAVPTEETSLRSYLSMRIGTHLGADLAAAIGGPGAIAEAAWEIEGLSGHTDLLIPGAAGSPDTVVEFKTVNPYSWRYANRPKPEHVLQLQLNAYGLLEVGAIDDGHPPHPQGPRLWLVYLNTVPKSEDDALELYELQYSYAEAAQELVRLRAAAQRPTLADRTFDPSSGDWQCRYCPYLTRCEADEMEKG